MIFWRLIIAYHSTETCYGYIGANRLALCDTILESAYEHKYNESLELNSVRTDFFVSETIRVRTPFRELCGHLTVILVISCLFDVCFRTYETHNMTEKSVTLVEI